MPSRIASYSDTSCLSTMRATVRRQPDEINRRVHETICLLPDTLWFNFSAGYSIRQNPCVPRNKQIRYLNKVLKKHGWIMQTRDRAHRKTNLKWKKPIFRDRCHGTVKRESSWGADNFQCTYTISLPSYCTRKNSFSWKLPFALVLPR